MNSYKLKKNGKKNETGKSIKMDVEGKAGSSVEKDFLDATKSQEKTSKNMKGNEMTDEIGKRKELKKDNDETVSPETESTKLSEGENLILNAVTKDKTMPEYQITDPNFEFFGEGVAESTRITEKFKTTVNRPALIKLYDSERVTAWNTTDVNDGYFKVLKELDKIPTLVKLKITKNGNHRGIGDDIQDENKVFSESNLVTQSADTFSPETQIIRFEQNDNFPVLVPDINDYESGKNILQIEYTRGARDNDIRRPVTLLSQLINCFAADRELSNIILSAPKKTLFNSAYHPNLVLNGLLDMKPATNDNIHPYYTPFIGPIDKINREILEVATISPATFGELEVKLTAASGIKLMSNWGLVTDQWCASILATNVEKFIKQKMTVDDLQNLLTACVMRDQVRVIVDTPPDQMLPYLRNPSTEAYNSTFLNIMISLDTKVNILDFMTARLQATNRIIMHPTASIFNMTDRPNDTMRASIYRALNTMLEVGEAMDINRVLVLETFSDFVKPEIIIGPQFDKAGGIMNILAFLAWPIIFPRLTQKMMKSIGFELMTAIKRFVGAPLFTEYTRVNGWVKRLTPGGVWIVKETNDVRLDDYGTPDEVMPSIFVPSMLPDRFENEKVRALYDLIAHIRDLFTLQFYPFELELTRRNGTPFYSDEYIAQLSWQPITKQEARDGFETETSRAIARLITILERCTDVYIGGQDKRYRTSGSNDWWRSFLDVIESSSENISPFLNYTCTSIQKWMMESPFFIFDGTRVDSVKSSPRMLAISAQKRDNNLNQSTPIPVDLVGYSFDPMLAFSVLIAGEGDFKRLVSYTDNFDSMKTGEALISREVLTVDYQQMIKTWYSLVRTSENIGKVFQLGYDLSHPGSPNNMITGIATEMSRYMILRSWSSVMSKLCLVAGAGPFDSIININKPYGQMETRWLRPMIVYMSKTSKSSMMLLADAPRMLYQELVLMDEYGRRNFTTLMKLYIAPTSPFAKRAIGIIIAKIGIQDRTPSVPDAVINQWFPNEVDIDDIEFLTQTRMGGRANVVNIPGLGVIDTPIDIRLRGVMITVRNTVQIPINFIDWMTQAILLGHVGLRILNKEIVYDIIDRPSRTIMYNDEMTTVKLSNLLKADASEVFNHTFETTEFAVNFSSVSLVVTGSIQWVSLIDPPFNDIATAVLTPTPEFEPNHRPIRGVNWGYGTYTHTNDYEGRMPITEEPKLLSRQINMNNKVPVILRGMFEPTPRILTEKIALTEFEF